jgi:hypothetical protein
VQTRNELTLQNEASGEPLRFQPRQVVLAGYTGRDRATVLKHIEELEAEGVAPPPSVPALYPGRPALLQVGGQLPAGSGWASGEIEFVLYVTEAGTFVGIGSDHTDRHLEQASIVQSKVAFPKILSPRVWPLDGLRGEWDSLVLRSWVSRNGQRQAYQSGTLAMIMTPEELLDLIPASERVPGLVLFSGTVPAVERAPEAGQCEFEGELLRPTGQVLAHCQYTYEASPSPANERKE